MSQKIQFRRGSTAEREAVTLDSGEPGWDTDTKQLYVGDGVTAGGIPVVGTSAIALDDLTDVDAAAPSNGDTLQWNSGTSTWEAGAPPSAPVSSVNGETGAVTLGAGDIGITDAGGYFTATDVEGALQELAATSAPKITSTVTSNTITPDGDTDLVRLPAPLAAGLTIANPTTTPADGEGYVVDLIDSGTSQSLTWGSKYATRMATLPTATTAGKRHRIGFEYNLADDKLYCMYAQVAP